MDETNLESQGGVRVSYSVKELLGRIDSSLAAINTKLDLKADSKEVERLSTRLDQQGERISSITNRLDTHERIQRDRSDRAGAQFTRWEKLFALAIALFVGLAPIILHRGTF
jgi:hypothetical protein